MKKICLALLLFLLPTSGLCADYYSAATALVQVRALLNETTASFWSDAEITAWIQQAVEDISSRVQCISDSDTFLLVTGQYEYVNLVLNGAATVTDIVKVWGAILHQSGRRIYRIKENTPEPTGRPAPHETWTSRVLLSF